MAYFDSCFTFLFLSMFYFSLLFCLNTARAKRALCSSLYLLCSIDATVQPRIGAPAALRFVASLHIVGELASCH